MRSRQLSMAVGSFFSAHWEARDPRPAAGQHLNGHFGLVPWRDDISTAILASSRGGTASQRPFWPRPVAGQHLNHHFGPVPWRDNISTTILAPSRGGTTSQPPFWPRPVAGQHLNRHSGPIPRRDEAAPSCVPIQAGVSLPASWRKRNESLTSARCSDARYRGQHGGSPRQ